MAFGDVKRSASDRVLGALAAEGLRERWHSAMSSGAQVMAFRRCLAERDRSRFRAPLRPKGYARRPRISSAVPRIATAPVCKATVVAMRIVAVNQNGSGKSMIR